MKRSVSFFSAKAKSDKNHSYRDLNDDLNVVMDPNPRRQSYEKRYFHKMLSRLQLRKRNKTEDDFISTDL